MDPGQADAILLHRLEEEIRQPDEEARHEKDDRDREQARHRAHEAEAQMSCGIEEELAERLSPGPRIRKPSEHEGQPRIGDEGRGGDHHQHDEPARELEHARGPQQRRIPYGKSLQSLARRLDETRCQQAVRSSNSPQQGEEDDRRGQRLKSALQQQGGRAKLDGLLKRLAKGDDGLTDLPV